MTVPNILIVSLDAVRGDHLGRDARQAGQTPALDRLAAEGTRYAAAYTPATWTLPTHTSLFTGLPVSSHGVAAHWTGRTRLSDKPMVTLAEHMRGLGYQSAAFSNAAPISPGTGLDRGFDRFTEVWRPFDESHRLWRLRVAGRYPGRRLHEYYVGRRWHRRDKGARRTNRLVGRWLREIRDSGRPFFAFVHYFEAHAPYWPPRRYRTGIPGASREEAEWARMPYDFLAGRQEIDDTAFERLRALYSGEVRYLDHVVGDLRRRLERAGVLDDTLLIVLADHGESFGEHGHYQHAGQSLHDHAVRVPLILRLPSAVPKGERRVDPVSLLDVAPTIVALLGDRAGGDARFVDQLRGRNLLDLPDPERAVVCESLSGLREELRAIDPEADTSHVDRELRALRWGRHKLIRGDVRPPVLYDMVDDPQEITDLAQERPELLAEMAARLDAWLADTPRCPAVAESEGGAEDMDDELRARLHALGYIGV